MARYRKKPALQALQDRSSYSKNAMEVLDWSYYDTAIIAAGTLIHRMFTVGLGGAKTLADTNMPNNNQLPQGQNLEIRAFKFFYKTDAAKATADVQSFYDLLNRTTFEFTVPGKDTLGTFCLDELFGMSTMFALTPTVAGDNIPLNKGEYRAVYPLNKPIIIGAVQTFEVRITHQVAPAAALDDDLLKISLNGILNRMS